MVATSVWEGTAQPQDFLLLQGDLEVDVAIVGGGITGVTLAVLLAAEGKSVAVLESGRIGSGSTGHSTGNLYEVVDDGVHTLNDKWGESVTRDVVTARRQAVDLIEQMVQRFDIHCGFVRCPLYRYAGTMEAKEELQRERAALSKLDIALTHPVELPLPMASLDTLRIDGQAQFHPLSYVRGLAQVAMSPRCRFFERSGVMEIDEDAHQLITASGRVTAQEIVLATHTPKGLYMVHAEMVPRREYGLALRLPPGGFPPGIFWGRGEVHHSLRALRADDASYLIAVGEPAKTGQHAADVSLERLEAFVTGHFPGTRREYFWSAQGYRSPDGLPYIGRSLGSSLHIATGFGANGLTWGTLAALIIADNILGRPNPWAELYRANRLDPVKSAKGVLEETASVAKVLFEDYVGRAPVVPLELVAPGQGKLVEVEGEVVAAYRDPNGYLSLVSSACTHLKCRVHWNAVEKSWDCPCHGSRFAPDGRVLEGPAISSLKKIQIKERE